MEEKEKEGKDKQAPGNKRIPDDRELSAISAHIGVNWEMLGPLLDVSSPTTDQIKLDFSSSRQRIFRLLYVWRSMKGPDATVESLLSQMRKASEVNIDWDNVEETIKRFDLESEEKRKADSNTFQSAAGAIPKTGMSEQPGYDETYIIYDRKQVLNLGNPKEKVTEQSKQDLEASSMAKCNNISLPTMQRELAPHTFSSANTAGTSGVTRATRTSDTSTATYAIASHGEALGNSNAANANSGENYSVEQCESDEDIITSISTIELKVKKIKNAVLKEKTEVKFVSQKAPDCVDNNKEARNTRLKAIFATGKDMRLKVLTPENVIDLLSRCGNEPEHKGGFGDIYVSQAEIPGIDMRLVMKKVKCSGEKAEQAMRSYTSEKLCARTMHFAIVPLLGIREDPNKREFYFLSPYMVNGNLNKTIEEDNNRIDEGQQPMLNVRHRLRIMFQIASAIDFLHTPVPPDIRGLILHMDIKSLNIVLDQYLNARIIDFGLAREMKDGHDHTSTKRLHYYATPGYDKLTQQQILGKHDDYRYFGVVMRELLTGRKPSIEGCPEATLKDQSVSKIKRASMKMWKDLEADLPVTDRLVDLSVKCITNKDITSKTLVTELKQLLADTNTKRWECCNVRKDQSSRCDMCLEYEAVKEDLLFHKDCDCNMNVCVSCMRNSYCNPIRCHSCDTILTPTIGHGWAALLIAGNDERDSVAKSFTDDVKAIHKVITSKCPLVMGVSADHVETVYPDEPGKPDRMLDKLKKSVHTLKNIDGIQTLLVYFSGHYKPNKGGFELSHCKMEERELQRKFEYLSKKDFEGDIASILHQPNAVGEPSSVPKRVIVFLDCCEAPAVTTPSQETVPPVTDMGNQLSFAEGSQDASGDANAQEILRCLTLDKNITIVQINACRPNQKSIQEEDGSAFRKFLIQGLTRKALGERCLNDPDCRLDCFIPGNFVTFANLNDYISNHLKSFKTKHSFECVMHTYNVSRIDAKIGYAINFNADLEFKYKFKEAVVEYDRIPQRMFSELRELQTLLFYRFLKKMKLDETTDEGPKLGCGEFCGILCGILCVEVEKGPKNHHRDRLQSLDRIMTAWNAKRELVVSLRILHEIYDGMVGIFMPCGQAVQPILEFLQKSAVVTTNINDHATICIVKLNNDLKQLVKDLDKLDDLDDLETRSSMNTFSDHIVDIDDALDKDPNEKINVKELHIIFPCSSSTDRKVHRRNFVCYQLKRANELQ